MAQLYPTPKPALQAAIAILTPAVTPTPVGFRMPNTRGAAFVRVSRVGGRMGNLVTDVPRILVECWGPDVGTVENLCNTCRAALLNACGKFFAGVYVREWVNEQGPVDFDDPEVTDMRRWQFHGDLRVSTN